MDDVKDQTFYLEIPEPILGPFGAGSCPPIFSSSWRSSRASFLAAGAPRPPWPLVAAPSVPSASSSRGRAASPDPAEEEAAAGAAAVVAAATPAEATPGGASVTPSAGPDPGPHPGAVRQGSAACHPAGVGAAAEPRIPEAAVLLA